MKKLCFLLLLLATANTKAQTYAWTNTFGGASNDDFSYSVATDAHSNVYIAGVCSNTSVDFDPSSDTAFLYSLTPGGSFSFIAKYDPSGNYVWAKNIGSNQCSSLCVDNAGNVFVFGAFNDSTDVDPSIATYYLHCNGLADVYLCKYDSFGNFVWGHGFGSTGDEFSLQIGLDYSSNVYITGSFSDTVDFDPSATSNQLISIGSSNAFLAKYNSMGDYIWAIGIGESGVATSRALSFDPQNNIYLTGGFYTSADFDPSPSSAILNSVGGSDIFIAKYDSLGNYIWAEDIGSTGSGEQANAIYFNSDNFCITGSFNNTVDFDPSSGITNLTSAGSADVFYAKYDTAGNLIFAKNVGGSGSDIGRDIKTDLVQNIYVTGYFKSTADFDPGIGNTSTPSHGTSFDIFIAKYDYLGNFIWVYPLGSSVDDMSQSLALNNSGDIYVTGWFSGTVDFNPGSVIDNHTSAGADDIFLSKYSDPTTSVEPIQTVGFEGFNIYPNPANNTLFCETYQNIHLYIYNASGALVFNQQLSSGKHSLDISSFTPGVYLARTSHSKGTVFIKQ